MSTNYSNPEQVEIYARAAITLRNFVCTAEFSLYSPQGFVNGEDRSGNVVEGSW